MIQDLSLILMLIGTIFIFLAAVGVLRFPDLFTRMHANTKSATLGIGLIMVGVALYFGDITVSTRALVVIVFLFITAPIGAHLLARAAYFSNVPLWEGTLGDDLRGHYDFATHELHGEDDTSGPAAENTPGEQV